MKLWLISQDVNGRFDTYDSAVVVAAYGEDARRIHPGRDRLLDGDLSRPFKDWVDDPALVTAEYLGETELEAGRVVCASFNAG